MRKINYIAPVDSMQGNLSGSQVLKYAENMNPAWDAPDGLQPAKNYKPRYVAARRAKDGAVYFAVKTKSSVNINAASRTRLAALGCLAATIAVLKDENAPGSNIQIGAITYNAWGILINAYKYAADENGIATGETLEKWVNDSLYQMYVNTQEMWNVAYRTVQGGTLQRVNILNPFCSNAITSGYFYITLPQRLYNKFNIALHGGTLSYVVYINKNALIIPEENWSTIAESTSPASYLPNYIASITPLSIEDDALHYNDIPVYLGETLVDKTDDPVDGAHYITRIPE